MIRMRSEAEELADELDETTRGVEDEMEEATEGTQFQSTDATHVTTY